MIFSKIFSPMKVHAISGYPGIVLSRLRNPYQLGVIQGPPLGEIFNPLLGLGLISLIYFWVGPFMAHPCHRTGVKEHPESFSWIYGIDKERIHYPKLYQLTNGC